MRNELSSSNRWIKLQLTRASGQIGAIGASITVYTAGNLGDPGEVIARRYITGATGYLAQNDTEIHIGLAGNSTVDLSVIFPGGNTTNLVDISTNGVVVVSE